MLFVKFTSLPSASVIASIGTGVQKTPFAAKAALAAAMVRGAISSVPANASDGTMVRLRVPAFEVPLSSGISIARCTPRLSASVRSGGRFSPSTYSPRKIRSQILFSRMR